MRSELSERLGELARRAGIGGVPGRIVWVAVALAATLVVVAAFRWARPPLEVELPSEPAPASTAPTSSAAESSNESTDVVVHVVGAVRRPGVYVLAPGARANDALKLAGGALGNADLAAVNLAAVLIDGEQLLVPKKGQAPQATAPSTGAAAAPGPTGSAGAKVNLNTAGESELDALPGVGPSTAKRIVQDREANGPFRAPEDLMRVPGIGPKKYDALKDLVTT